MGSQLESKCMDDRNYIALKAHTAWDPKTQISVSEKGWFAGGGVEWEASW